MWNKTGKEENISDRWKVGGQRKEEGEMEERGKRASGG